MTETFNLPWNKALKLNYKTFIHYCNYIKHKKTEELKAIKKANK